MDPKNGAVSGAEMPVLVPYSFPRIVTVFPFLHSLSPGTGRRTRAKSEARKRKETPRELGVSEINAAFFNAYRSGEIGIRTLGTLAGTPVFKTGAGFLRQHGELPR